MSWSVTAKGLPSRVLQSIEVQIGAVAKNLEEIKAKEEHVIKAHLGGMMQFLSQHLSNSASNAHVEVTAVGHKSEGMIHEIELKIRHVEPPVEAKPAEDPASIDPASTDANGSPTDAQTHS